MEREGFVFYQSFRNATKTLPKDNQKNALVMMIEYWIDWTLPDPNSDGIAFAIFQMSKPQIDKNNQRYLSGKLGWKPKDKDQTKRKPKANQTLTKPTPKDKDKDNVKEKEKEWIVLYNPPEFYLFLEEFIDKENPTIKYQLSINKDYLKSQSAELDKLIKDWYSLESIKTVLNFIKHDEFRKKQILSIKKLREKNKEWVPYIVVMIEKIKQRTPPKQSVAFIPWIFDHEWNSTF